jgi:hypothetical protein
MLRALKIFSLRGRRAQDGEMHNVELPDFYSVINTVVG